MNLLGLAVFAACALCMISAEGTSAKVKQATQSVYQAVQQNPYRYRTYGGSAQRYHYDPYNRHDTETFGAYPAAYDLGAHRLHLSGGIYRPYEYDEAAYHHNTPYNSYAYDNAYRYYDNSAAQYVKYPYSQYNRRY